MERAPLIPDEPAPFADVVSVSDYREALGWLFRHMPMADQRNFMDGHPAPLLVRFLCALFWVAEDQARKDMLKLWRGV